MKLPYLSLILLLIISCSQPMSILGYKEGLYGDNSKGLTPSKAHSWTIEAFNIHKEGQGSYTDKELKAISDRSVLSLIPFFGGFNKTGNLSFEGGEIAQFRMALPTREFRTKISLSIELADSIWRVPTNENSLPQSEGPKAEKKPIIIDYEYNTLRYMQARGSKTTITKEGKIIGKPFEGREGELQFSLMRSYGSATHNVSPISMLHTTISNYPPTPGGFKETKIGEFANTLYNSFASFYPSMKTVFSYSDPQWDKPISHETEIHYKDGTKKKTRCAIGNYYYPQVEYHFTIGHIYKDGSKAYSRKKIIPSNLKKPDKVITPIFPYKRRVNGWREVNWKKGYGDIQWKNPDDKDIYAVKISWIEDPTEPGRPNREGYMIIRQNYRIDRTSGKMIFDKNSHDRIEFNNRFGEKVTFEDIILD